MKHWKKLAALALAGLMVFAFAACAQAKETATTQATEEADPVAPTGEGTQVNESLVPTIDPETYKEYIGIWYADGSSASYRINVKDDGTWDVTNGAGDIVASGTLRVNEEEESLEMYDPDGSLALTVKLVAEGEIQVDVMLESLFDSMTTTTFLNKVTNDVSDAPPTITEDGGESSITEEENVTLPPVEEEVTG